MKKINNVAPALLLHEKWVSQPFSILLSGNRELLRAAFLQTLYSISSEKNHTIVFPLPIDVIGHMVGGGKPGAKQSNLHTENEKKSLWRGSEAERKIILIEWKIIFWFWRI